MFCHSIFSYFSKELKNLTGNYLEIGVFNGDSIAGLAKQYPNKTIVGIDPFLEDGYTSCHTSKSTGEHLDVQKTSTKQYINGINNIKFYEMTSEKFSEMLTDELVNELNISGVLIDGDHHYKHVRIDALLALRLIGNKQGHIAFDDITLKDIVQVICEFRDMVKDRIDREFHIGDNQYIFVLKEINE